MNQEGKLRGDYEARRREAQVGAFTRLNQDISTLTNRMEQIEITLGNPQGSEVILNEGVENEEDENEEELEDESFDICYKKTP